MLPVVAAVVEGHGEVKSVPTLIRRLAAENGVHAVDVPNPWRVDRGRMANGLADVARLAARRVSATGGLLVIVDADDDCPVELATALEKNLKGVVNHCPVEIAVACREFEAWFLASQGSLIGHRDVSAVLAVRDPDVPRGAKELLASSMSRKYSPPIHQPAFVARMDLVTARRTSRSFRHLCEAVARLVAP